jgi:hypothetical protein
LQVSTLLAAWFGYGIHPDTFCSESEWAKDLSFHFTKFILLTKPNFLRIQQPRTSRYYILSRILFSFFKFNHFSNCFYTCFTILILAFSLFHTRFDFLWYYSFIMLILFYQNQHHYSLQEINTHAALCIIIVKKKNIIWFLFNISVFLGFNFSILILIYIYMISGNISMDSQISSTFFPY